jgi:hypothetical protein
MYETNHTLDVSGIARGQGIKQPVRVSAALADLLQPNQFLSDLGIRFPERMDNILSILKGMLVPQNGGLEETLPPDGIGIPFALTQGPFIREIPLTIWVNSTRSANGETEFVLSVIHDEDGN